MGKLPGHTLGSFAGVIRAVLLAMGDWTDGLPKIPGDTDGEELRSAMIKRVTYDSEEVTKRRGGE